MDSFKDISCEEFVNQLASKTPVPGGGGASALAAALGTALGEMVVSLTIGKKKYINVEQDMRSYAAQAEKLGNELLALIDADAEAFGVLIETYKLPSSTDDEKNKKSVKLEESLKIAASVPLEIMKRCCQSIELIEKIAETGNRAAISDAACGALVCAAALKSASMNVLINTSAMRDKAYAAGLNDQVGEMIDEYGGRADAVYMSIRNSFMGSGENLSNTKNHNNTDAGSAKACSGQKIETPENSAKILSGKEVAETIKEDCVRLCSGLKNRGIIPTLAVVRLGSEAADLAYERGLKKTADAVGIMIRVKEFAENAEQGEILEEIKKLNADSQVHGILVFKPLPAHVSDELVCRAISPEKDIDGVSPLSMAHAYSGTGVGFYPCTAVACMEILKHYGFSLSGRKVSILGRSPVIGKPLAMLLMAENATVTICHSKTEDLCEQSRDADILAVCIGRSGMIDENYVDGSKEQIILDIGINSNEDGNLSGDVDFEAVLPHVAAITPVPGGVGSVTSAVLMRNVLTAAKNRNPLSAL